MRGSGMNLVNLYIMNTTRIAKVIMPFALLLIISMPSCYYDNTEETYPGGVPCDTSAVTWTLDIQPMVNGHCSGCHNGTQQFDISTYASVKAIVIDGRMMQAMSMMQGMPKKMPPGYSLPDCTLLKTQLWIDQGALEN